jgi:hypothetical protein
MKQKNKKWKLFVGCPINEKQKIPRTHCRNSSKSNKRNRKNRHKMDTPNTQIHDRLLSCFGTGIALFNAYDSLCVTKIKHNMFKVIALFIITRFARLYVRVRVLQVAGFD